MNMFIDESLLLRRKVADSPTERHLYIGEGWMVADFIIGFSWVFDLWATFESWPYLAINSCISRSSCHSKSANIL